MLKERNLFRLLGFIEQSISRAGIFIAANTSEFKHQIRAKILFLLMYQMSQSDHYAG